MYNDIFFLQTVVLKIKKTCLKQRGKMKFVS